MIEVLWHGRGGQGAFTAARLLGAAVSLSEGRFALAFPSFGPERRGAPVRAFTKLDDKPIGDRSAIARADFVVYLDETLLGNSWEDELKPNGKILVNSVRSYDDERIVAIDADGISSGVLGRPIPNTVFLGALAALSDRVDIEAVRDAVQLYMPKKLHEGNLAIVDAVFGSLREQALREGSPEGEALAEAQAQASGAPCDAHGEEAASFACSDALSRAVCRIPSLRSEELDPCSFARSTCFEAGYLVGKNAGWRNVRPVVEAARCSGCLQCYLYCPDGAAFKCHESVGEQAVFIDYDFCKGCGICARVCKFGAISLILERAANEDKEAAR